jgi:quinoprotein glucose dehydrogenase
LLVDLLTGLLVGQEPQPAGRAEAGAEAAPRRYGYAVVEAFPGQKPFARPLLLAHHAVDPDVYYVVEQEGRIHRIPRDGKKPERHLFLDWRAATLSHANGGHDEEGLLGFAFDPAHTTNGFVYIYYSRRAGSEEVERRGRTFRVPKRESVVARLKTAVASGQRIAAPDSEFVILRVAQPWGNHNGGTIAFGPDHMLYVALGDGGAANDPHGNGQDLGTLLGSILRIDVRGATVRKPYSVPEDNPFVGRAGAHGEIFAYGLRNPWRISFDPVTGDLWCGDVGQNLWEEVDRIVKGGNYGWNVFEGTQRFPPGADEPESEEAVAAARGMVPPIAEYHHRAGVSITGGHVYRGKELPELVGWYLYADYVTGRGWAVREDRRPEAGKREHEVVEILRRAGSVASFAETADRETLVLRYDNGRISKLVRAPAARDD